MEIGYSTPGGEGCDRFAALAIIADRYGELSIRNLHP
jgi:hypothetical protein